MSIQPYLCIFKYEVGQMFCCKSLVWDVISPSWKQTCQKKMFSSLFDYMQHNTSTRKCKIKHNIIVTLNTVAKMLGAGGVLTSKNGFVGFELLPSHIEAAVCEAWTLPQVPQVIRQLTLWYFQHVHVGLARNVNGVLDNTYLYIRNITERKLLWSSLTGWTS